MIYKIKVKRHKSDNNWFSAKTAEVIVNGKKYEASGDRPDVMDGISLEGAIIDCWWSLITAKFKFEYSMSFLSWFGYWRGDPEMVEYIRKFEGKSQYVVDSQDIKRIYDRWAKEELPKLKERDRKWKEENDKLEKQGKPRNDRIKCERIVIESMPISKEPVVKWNEVQIKRFNVIDRARERMRAIDLDEFKEDKKFMDKMLGKMTKKKSKRRKK